MNRLGHIKPFVDVSLLQKRQQMRPPRIPLRIARIGTQIFIPRRQHGKRRDVVVHRNAVLLEIIFAAISACSRSRTVNRWKQQTDQHRNNCNDNEKFDKCKGAALHGLNLLQHTSLMLASRRYVGLRDDATVGCRASPQSCQQNKASPFTRYTSSRILADRNAFRIHNRLQYQCALAH